jgi:methylthioribulose-1-phosphate dehydratase
MIEPDKENFSEAGESPRRACELAARLAEIGRGFYARGWVLGTSGNFSAVVSRNPIRLAITSSGVDKSLLAANHILQIDGDGKAAEGSSGHPSAEALLHLMLARTRGAGAVLHTHSVWSNIVSELYAREGGVKLEGFEMLKGLAGVTTHEHAEWLPVVENSQDIAALSPVVEQRLKEHPGAHGFLLRRHGLYTWGRDLTEAQRHVEILEFLLEVTGRTPRTEA